MERAAARYPARCRRRDDRDGPEKLGKPIDVQVLLCTAWKIEGSTSGAELLVAYE